MYVLGVDFGGGSSKATLIDEQGKIIATSTTEYPTIYGEGGKVEQNPEDWYKAACKNIFNCIKSIDKTEVRCICFDAATHTAVLMDEHFNVVRNSVYWTDTRSVKQKEYLALNFSSDIFNKFKHNVDTIWTLPQLLWVKEIEPSVWKKVKRIFFAKDYVRHKFTGDFCTDYIEAEGSMFFDFEKQKWDKKYLDVLGIDETFLPLVKSPLDNVGTIKKEIADKFGFTYDTKVICGSTDTAMEVFASGAVQTGDTTIKLATAGRICVVSDKLTPDPQIINYSHVIKGLFYPGTATKSCAASLRWFRDTFGGSFEEFSDMAENVNIGCDGLIFHPYLNGELTPYGDPSLRGSFIGVSGIHSKAHFARAVMEGVALSLLDCKKYLEKNGIKMTSAKIIGGGAKSRVWRQIISDCLGIKLIMTENNDSSFGSAMMAGIAVGLFKDEKDAVNKCSVIIGETIPNFENNKKYAQIFEKYKKVQVLLKEIYND